MSDAPILPPAAPPPPEPVPAPITAPAPAAVTVPPPPKSRRWFVVLAWVTLIAFCLFVAGITVVTAALPQIRKAREASR